MLHLLCYSEDAFSFEILAQQGAIQILFTANESDSFRLKSQLEAYFPTVIIKILEWNALNFDLDKPIAIADFGLENEFMLPTQSSHSYNIDPLTSIIATLSHLEDDEVGLFKFFLKALRHRGQMTPCMHQVMVRAEVFLRGHPDFISGVRKRCHHRYLGLSCALQFKARMKTKVNI